MSNSQEQSLNENVVFLPVDESSPQFLHSEREREAVERLLDSGPEAFYGSIGPELSSYFLSPEEVSRISSWAQNYNFHEPLVGDQNGADRSVDSEKICSTYDPHQWDVPVPNLELGWPEKPAGLPKNSVTVHSSHLAEGDLSSKRQKPIYKSKISPKIAKKKSFKSSDLSPQNTKETNIPSVRSISLK